MFMYLGMSYLKGFVITSSVSLWAPTYWKINEEGHDDCSLDLEMFYTTFYIVFKILGMLCLHGAKHRWSTEQFIHHLNVSRHADIGPCIETLSG